MKLSKELSHCLQKYIDHNSKFTAIKVITTLETGCEYGRHIVGAIKAKNRPEKREYQLQLIDAVLHGWEVEQTPEEAVKAYYDDLQQGAKRQRDRGEVSAAMRLEASSDAVKHTLNLLGIDIEGINAHTPVPQHPTQGTPQANPYI